MDNHTKAVSATFLVEGQGKAWGENENCRWKPSLCGIFRIGFSQRNIPGKLLLFSGRVPVCVGLPDQKAGLWCSCLPHALTPGEREHLVQGSHFNARLRALTFHFLYWRVRQCLHFTSTRLILHPNKTQLSSLLKKEAPNLHCVTVILAIEDTRDSEFNICWRRTKQESPPGIFPHLSSVLTTCSV